MKISFKAKIAVVLVVTGLCFSCKKNETTPADADMVREDSSAVMVDTMNTVPADTTMTDTTKTMETTPAQ